MASTRVLVLYTGAKDDVLRYIPGIGERDGIHWELLSDPALPPVDSSGIRAKDWLNMAAVLEREYANWDGFVILHGTDTMAYTASALSFLCENLGKPVVLTEPEGAVARAFADIAGKLRAMAV